jgi:hypothetical protein
VGPGPGVGVALGRGVGLPLGAGVGDPGAPPPGRKGRGTDKVPDELLFPLLPLGCVGISVIVWQAAKNETEMASSRAALRMETS